MRTVLTLKNNLLNTLKNGRLSLDFSREAIPAAAIDIRAAKAREGKAQMDPHAAAVRQEEETRGLRQRPPAKHRHAPRLLFRRRMRMNAPVTPPAAKSTATP